MRNGYVVYPSNRGFMSLAAARRAAKAEARAEGSARIESVDTQRVVARYGRSNPSRHLTKTQRKEKSRRASANRRVANALKKFLQQANPGRKLAGASVRKNKGSITIVPVFLKKRK